MPDGTIGRGFVNPITWSFLGEAINAIDDDSLVTAYCGWAWLFPRLQQNAIATNFQSDEEEQKFREVLTLEEIENVKF